MQNRRRKTAHAASGTIQATSEPMFSQSGMLPFIDCNDLNKSPTS